MGRVWVMGACFCSKPWACADQNLNSAEAAIALRQRLNETVDQLDTLQKEHAELEVKFGSQSKELTIAKSDREFVLFITMLLILIR